MKIHSFSKTVWRLFCSRLHVYLVLSVLCVAPACHRSSHSETLPLLTTAQQIRDLSPEQAELGYPIQIRGVATYYDLVSKTLILQDSTNGVLIDTSKTQRPMAGQVAPLPVTPG